MTPICKVEGCGRVPHGRGLCHTHYEAARRNGEIPKRGPTLRQRFDELWEEQVGPLDTPCHVWQRSRNYSGYGMCGAHDRAHRVAWERVNGQIPDGLNVLHKCDVRACVNPEHLFLGTQLENVRDRVRKGRGARTSGVKNGSAILNETDVERIRDIWRVGGVTQKGIAKYFGIAHCTANAIIKRRLWAHV